MNKAALANKNSTLNERNSTTNTARIKIVFNNSSTSIKTSKDTKNIAQTKPIALIFDSRSAYLNSIFPNQDAKRIVYESLVNHLSSAGFEILPEGAKDFKHTVYIKYKADMSDRQYTPSNSLDPTLIRGIDIECDLEFGDYNRHLKVYPPKFINSPNKYAFQITQDIYNETLNDFSSQFTSIILSIYQ
jgi:hypothetical protein